MIPPYSGGTGTPPLPGLTIFGDLFLSSAPEGSAAGSTGSLDMNDRNNRRRTSEALGDPFFPHPWSLDILVPSVHGSAMVGGGL